MKNLLITSTLYTLVLAASLMASGPRVTAKLFAPIQNEIVSLESIPFYTNTISTGGMVFEIVQAALNSQKEKATLTTYPVENMIKYYITQEKSLAALAVNMKLSKAEKKSIITIPVALIAEQYMYYKPAHPKGISFDSKLSKLKGLTYGANKGEDTRVYKKAGIKVVYGIDRFLFKKLKTQKVDFIKAPVLSSKAIIDTHFKADENLFAVMKSHVQKSVCMIHFNLKNKKAKEMAKKFREGLIHIIKNGTYEKLLVKYQVKTNDATKSVTELKTLLKKGF